MFRAIADMPAASLWGLVAIGVVASVVLGFVTHMVMRDRGFGMIPNGILMVVGLVAGVWARYAIFGSL